jgi:hypothetical protein
MRDWALTLVSLIVVFGYMAAVVEQYFAHRATDRIWLRRVLDAAVAALSFRSLPCPRCGMDSSDNIL